MDRCYEPTHVQHARILPDGGAEAGQAEHNGALASEKHAFFVECHRHAVALSLSLSAAYEWEHSGVMNCCICGSRLTGGLSPAWSGGELKV